MDWKFGNLSTTRLQDASDQAAGKGHLEGAIEICFLQKRHKIAKSKVTRSSKVCLAIFEVSVSDDAKIARSSAAWKIS